MPEGAPAGGDAAAELSAPVNARRMRGLSIALRVSLALFITAAFVALVAGRIQLQDLGATLAGVGSGRLTLGLAVVCATVLLRAARLCVCLGERLGATMLSVSVVHNAAVALLPAKLGEFALPALLARVRGTEALLGVGVLILLRVFDLLALGLVGGLAASVAYAPRGGVYSALLLSAAAGSALMLYLLVRRGPAIARALAARSQDAGRRSFLARLVGAAATMGGRAGSLLAALSVAIWVSLFTSFYVFAGAVASSTTWVDAAVKGTAGSLAFALPISGVANVGPFQAAWVAAASTLGFSTDAALMSSLLAHGAVLVVTVALAAVAGGILLLRRGEQRP